MAIIIQKGDKELERLEHRKFKQERKLRDFIIDNPSVIPLHEPAEDPSLTVISDKTKEFYTTNGPIDILALDRHGQVCIIETKLNFNHDRRKVVAQVLDYAAALWRDFSSGADSFIEAVEKRYDIDFKSKLAKDFDIEEEDTAAIIDNLSDSLKNGSFKLIVLMDEVDQNLKDLILFVNSNSQFYIYAVELKYYKRGELSIIIPELYGAEVQKRVANSSRKPSALDIARREFWQGFIEYANEQSYAPLHELEVYKGGYSIRIWVWEASEKVGIYLNVWHKELQVALWIEGDQKLYENLSAHKKTLEKDLGSELCWEQEVKKRRLNKFSAVGKEMKWQFDNDTTAQRQDYFKWLHKTAKQFISILPKYLALED